MSPVSSGVSPLLPPYGACTYDPDTVNLLNQYLRHLRARRLSYICFLPRFAASHQAGYALLLQHLCARLITG